MKILFLTTIVLLVLKFAAFPGMPLIVALLPILPVLSAIVLYAVVFGLASVLLFAALIVVLFGSIARTIEDNLEE